METILSGHKEALQKILEHFQRELQGVRTGRATPSLVENITVLAYETQTPISQLATITAPDAKTISIQPWDKSVMKAMEGAIRDAGIGLSPVVDGPIIRISMPMLTQENRKQLARIVRDNLEEARIALRAQREKIRDEIMEMEKGKEISEDDRFRLLKKLDEFIQDYSKRAEEIARKKEDEIMAL